MEEEMDTAAAVDAEQERILYDAVENDLCLRNILGKFLPVVSFIVANQSGAYSDSMLRLASVLSLCRFMSTSSVICEASLPLLFTTLEREASVQVRSTIVIALGDLAFRFPNSVEPWTDRIYMRLSDTSAAVRYNTLMVITHLVLNDMLKVKGQVSQVVLSLNDSCTEVTNGHSNALTRTKTTVF
jgi:condensin complex subunit 1